MALENLCTSPIWATNKYTKKKILTRCGKCHSCQNLKNSVNNIRVNNEFATLKKNKGIALFVTLTYSNDFIPVYTLDHSEDDYILAFRRGANPEQIDIRRCDTIFKVKEYPCDAIGVLVKEHLISFVNNLRRRIQVASKGDKSFYETFKFRYFGIGEYGTTTKRPHYHILLFFHNLSDYNEVSEVLQKVIIQSWKFGSIDIKSCNGGATTNYITSYMSSAQKIPSYLRHKTTKPFYVMSRRPSIGGYLDDHQISDFYEKSVSSIVDRDVNAFFEFIYSSSDRRLVTRETYKNQFNKLTSIPSGDANFDAESIRYKALYISRTQGYKLSGLGFSELFNLKPSHFSYTKKKKGDTEGFSYQDIKASINIAILSEVTKLPADIIFNSLVTFKALALSKNIQKDEQELGESYNSTFSHHYNVYCLANGNFNRDIVLTDSPFLRAIDRINEKKSIKLTKTKLKTYGKNF